MSRQMAPATLALAALTALAACKDNRTAATTPADSVALAATPAAAAAPAGSTAAVSTPAAPPANVAMDSTGIPSAMDQAEGLAEDVQDDITGANWNAAQAKATQLQKLTNDLSATGTSQQNLGAYNAYVDSLSSAVQGKQRYAALMAANHVSRVMNQMMANYPTRIPIQVAYMDVAGRDVQYDADQGDWQGASDALNELQRNYAAVQAHVKGSKAALDTRVSGELTHLQQAIAAKNKSRVDALAKQVSDDVDNVENTY